VAKRRADRNPKHGRSQRGSASAGAAPANREPAASRRSQARASENDRRAFERLPALLQQAGIAAGAEALRIMRAHYDLLLRWNRRINLTAVRNPREVVARHFLESAYLVKALPLGRGLLYDVGSGAGFPGLPVKALHPEITVVLVESNLKKVAFLKEVIREAGLEGARVESGRVESLPEREAVQLADWITMRAVGDVSGMLGVFRRLLKPRGWVALFLGQQGAAQVAGSEPGFAWRDPLPIPGSERRVILVGQALTGA
jgi:16S rRNA (guanine527-N7)-methyltransferase